MNLTGLYGKTVRAALLPLVISISCISHHDAAVTDVDPEGWSDPAVIEYMNRDTLSRREIALIIRYSSETAGGRFIIEAESPSGTGTMDTVYVKPLPLPHSGRIEELRLAYRTGVIFGEEGRYLFTVIPPVGTHGIWSTGVDFQKQ